MTYITRTFALNSVDSMHTAADWNVCDLVQEPWQDIISVILHFYKG